MALNEMQKRERAEYLERNLTITECSQRQPYVFISYASDDWEKVFKTAVVPLQKRYGMRVYADKAFDRVNDRWIVPMLRNIRAAEVVLAFVSQSYIESYACFLEMLTAVNSRRHIVFVALEENLHLGDTTDQPALERGVKSELMNQGANMVTNINNTANDIMRAMKSAYTNISTLVEQDALSKYDISDAFINFFRDAAVNRKSINDLNALRYTIRSVSGRVFDPAMAEVREPEPEPVPVEPAPAAPAPVEAVPAAAAAPQPAESPAAAPAPAPAAPPVSPVHSQTGENTAYRPESPAPQVGGPNKTLVIGGAVLAVVLAVVLFLVLGGRGGGDDAADNDAVAEPTATAQPEADSGKVSEGTVTLNGATYVGQLLDGVPEGTGTGTYSDGSVYEGEWKNGLPEGQGKFTNAYGNIYEGEFKAGAIDGQGKCAYYDGGVYEGEFKKGFRDGWGKCTYPNGEVYQGEWKNDAFSGYGHLTYASGELYNGEWKAGQLDGKGTWIGPDGDVYEGEWKAGLREGQGTSLRADGRLQYVGGWSAGTLSGLGMHIPNQAEQVFVGYFAEGTPNGEGIVYDPGEETVLVGYFKGNETENKIDCEKATIDGGNYTGELSENGVPEGLGILKKGDEIQLGLFRNGKLSFGYWKVNDFVYAGELTDGAMTGYGAVAFASGEVAINEWQQGKRNGYGINIGSDKASTIGYWQNDQYQQ